MNAKDPEKLVRTLCTEPRESEWLEFKVNVFDADECGRYISGLANAAILSGARHAYLVFGVDDERRIVGTTLKLKSKKIGNEPFENWVSPQLNPRLNLQFLSVEVDGKNVEVIIIDPAYERPVRFKEHEYIRIDTALTVLRDYPERARTLWELTSRFAFEQGVAATHLSPKQILSEFDCVGLLKLLGANALNPKIVLEYLVQNAFIYDDKQGGYDATNLLAIVCANDLHKYPSVSGKAPRVIQYRGKSKQDAAADTTGVRGYAVTFNALLRYIMQRISYREEMRHGTREIIYAYPEVAVREIVANALIHQDLSARGAGPIVEIYDDRIQVTNPGAPLIPTERFIDAPAKSRNEQLSNVLRLAGLCEKRGSGIDRALDAIEREALPPPLFQVVENSTVVTLIGERPFAGMTKEERVRACYQHAALRYVANDPMSNGSLRMRFGLSEKQYPQVSLVIRDAIDQELIKPVGEDQPNRNARYIPHWG